MSSLRDDLFVIETDVTTVKLMAVSFYGPQSDENCMIYQSCILMEGGFEKVPQLKTNFQQ